MRWQSSVAVGIIILGLLCFSVQVVGCWPLTLDDAYINFRYSANLAAGYGATWNPGEPPVEGYVSFLWIAFMALPHLLGLNVVLFAKVTGILLTAGYMYVSFRFVRLIQGLFNGGRSSLAPAAVVLMLGCFPPTAFHAVSGMDTALFTFLLTCFFYVLTLVASRPSRKLIVLLAVLGLLAGLTRPDGNLPVLVGLLLVLWLIPHPQRGFLVGSVALLYLVPGIVYFLCRYAYYGLLLPLPFYVKVSSQGLCRGVLLVLGYLSFLAVHAGILLVLALFRFDKKLLPAALGAGALLLFFVFPDQIMGMQWRYLFPTTPFVFVLAGLGLSVIQRWLQSRPAPSWATAGVSGLLVLVAISVITGFQLMADLPRPIQWSRHYAYGLRDAHIRLGRHLSCFGCGKQTPTLVMGDTGATPYFSRWRTVDLYGLNDRTIALAHRADEQYVFSRHPDVAVLVSVKENQFKGYLPCDQSIYDSCVRRGMTHAKTLRFDDAYYLWILCVPDTPIARDLQQWE